RPEPEPVAEVTEPEPVVDAPTPVEAVADEAEVVADSSGEVKGSEQEPGPEETAREEQATWTRAVSFGRKSAEQSDPEPEPVAEVTEPEPVVEVPTLVEAVADEAEVVADSSGEVQGSEPEPGPEETAPEEQVWTREVSFNRAPDPEPVAAAPLEAA